MSKSPASPLALFRQDTAVIALKERGEWQTKWDNYLSQDKPVQDRRRPGSRYCLISIVMRLCYELILASRKSRNCDLRASLVTQTVKKKNLPATLKTQVQSLGQEDPMEKEMAIHSSIIA